MNLFVLNIILALAWISLTGQLTPLNFGFGFVLGFLVLWLGERRTPSGDYFMKVPQVIRFIIVKSAEALFRVDPCKFLFGIACPCQYGPETPSLNP